MSDYKCSCGESFEKHGGLAVHLRYNKDHKSNSKLNDFMESIDTNSNYIAYIIKINYEGEDWYYTGETCRPYERFSRHFGEGMEIRNFPAESSKNYEVEELIYSTPCDNEYEARNMERVLMLAVARWFNTFRVLGGS